MRMYHVAGTMQPSAMATLEMFLKPPESYQSTSSRTQLIPPSERCFKMIQRALDGRHDEELEILEGGNIMLMLSGPVPKLRIIGLCLGRAVQDEVRLIIQS